MTGCAGFIGSNFCRYVLEKYADDHVIGLDALTYSGNLSTIADLQLNEKFSFVHARIEDQATVEKVIVDEKIDSIVNFAAETHNDRSILEDADFLTTNVIGVNRLLSAVRKLEVQKMVHVSTDEVYGSIDVGEFTEESPIQPNTPYSASKASGDLQCRAHFVTYKTPVVVTRGGNTYGPYQYPEKLISFFSVRLIDGKKVPVYGDGTQVREWIHARDHAAGIDLALRRGEPGEVYNIGDQNERQNMQIVSLLLSELGQSSELVKQIPDPRKGAHDKRYSMSAAKISSLGWSPQVPFEQGMRETIRWYKENREWWGPICDRAEYQAFVKRFYGPGLGEDL
ncbi:MAG: dTDP-glucose 4,6-dehydratase [Fimbriimonadales bacterium]